MSIKDQIYITAQRGDLAAAEALVLDRTKYTNASADTKRKWAKVLALVRTAEGVGR